MTNAHRDALFDYTEKAAINSILQTTMLNYIAGGISAEGSATNEALTKLTTNGKELLQKFISACHQPFRTGKQLAQSYYFEQIEYWLLLRIIVVR